MADGNDSGACLPCGGSGRVISSLGGEPHEVACPWCDGGGVWIAEHDAQAAWASRREQAQAEQTQSVQV